MGNLLLWLAVIVVGVGVLLPAFVILSYMMWRELLDMIMLVFTRAGG